MNTDTGKLYFGREEIDAAIDRGEPVVPVSQHVADLVQAGEEALSRQARRRLARERAKRER